jgi:catechol-2,3-dioxygenase
MQIHRLQLFTDRLPALREFYTQVLGFALVAESESSFVVQCGQSQLEYVQGESAYYHFAYNIVPDQLISAAAWLKEKGIALLPFENEEIVDFPNWKAQSVYFYDPAGNILEFIARRRLPERGHGAFSISDVLNISEIGIGTYEFKEMHAFLHHQMNVPVFGTPSPIFYALGDDHGLFILVDAHVKKWIPMMEPALPFPYAAEISEAGQKWRMKLDGAGFGANLV